MYTYMVVVVVVKSQDEWRTEMEGCGDKGDDYNKGNGCKNDGDSWKGHTKGEEYKGWYRGYGNGYNKGDGYSLEDDGGHGNDYNKGGDCKDDGGYGKGYDKGDYHEEDGGHWNDYNKSGRCKDDGDWGKRCDTGGNDGNGMGDGDTGGGDSTGDDKVSLKV